MTDENVLVIPTQHIPHFFDGKVFQKSNLLELEALLQLPYLEFIPREQAEKNFNYVQIIPYMIFESHKDVFSYQRTKLQGEDRLHGKYSLGIGGHINDNDAYIPYNAFFNGLNRELYEELGVTVNDVNGWDPTLYKFNCLLQNMPIQIRATIEGFIYDPSNEVGKVHMGVVLKCRVEHDFPYCHVRHIPFTPEKSMANAYYRPLERIKDNIEDYEIWSQICIQHVL
jgi:predicted NUDIX family phosphoesterase